MSSPDASPARSDRPRLRGLTPESCDALGALEIELGRLPYRIGRESRKRSALGLGFSRESRSPDRPPTNDLYLADNAEVVNVSREHLQIEPDGAGYALVDRGSTCGTLVEGRRVGGDNAGGRAGLAAGDVIIVGSSSSPWVFKFLLG